MSGAPPETVPVRTAVLVAHGLGLPTWPDAHARGRLPGLNEAYAYGYHRAAADGFEVSYSRDGAESGLARLGRLGVRAALGFDLVHAWRNRRLLAEADAIWTHTESQSLAVGALARLGRLPRRPVLLLQSVWLVDRWPRLDPLRRVLYRHLLREADVLTFHATLAVEAARAHFPDARVERVLFGIATDARAAPRAPRPGRPLRLVALGNDRHRDWKTLVSAVGSRPGLELTIVSRTLPERLIRQHANIRRLVPDCNAELLGAIDAADVGVVPLRPNLHASGITTIQELALRGVPIVASDTGGLRDYFDDDEVRYVPPGDPEALAEALDALDTDPREALAMARRAGARMGGELGLSSARFVHRHVELTRTLLADRAVRTSPGSA